MNFAKRIQLVVLQIILSYLCVSLANFTSDDTNSSLLRITGGRLAGRNEFPYQVALYVYNEGSFAFYCGGSIYNSRYIITAAHCLRIPGTGQNVDAPILRVLVGSLEIPNRVGFSEESSRGLIRVRRVQVHPQFSPGSIRARSIFTTLPSNDIGLLELENDLIFSNSVRRIRIANRNEVSRGTADVSGWGYTTIYPQLISNEPARDVIPLKTVRLNIYSRTVCNARYGTSTADTWLCVGSLLALESSCNGDSGGPLACRRSGVGESYLCGIVSNGQGCGLPLTPHFATDVGRFYNFITGIAGVQQN